MAPLDVVQAEAEVATRRQIVAQAEATWRTAELSLKRLIVNGTDDPLWRASMNPTDRPVFSPEPLDVEGAVRKALGNRTDLEQAPPADHGQRHHDSVHAQSDSCPPSICWPTTARRGSAARSSFVRAPASAAPSSAEIPGGFPDALRTLTARDYPTWNVQVNVAYPLGGSAADANYARARVQLSQSAAQLRALELQVATDVTNAALQVESGLTRYEAALGRPASWRRPGSRPSRAVSTLASRPISSSSRRSATW